MGRGERGRDWGSTGAGEEGWGRSIPGVSCTPSTTPLSSSSWGCASFSSSSPSSATPSSSSSHSGSCARTSASPSSRPSSRLYSSRGGRAGRTPPGVRPFWPGRFRGRPRGDLGSRVEAGSRLGVRRVVVLPIVFQWREFPRKTPNLFSYAHHP